MIKKEHLQHFLAIASLFVLILIVFFYDVVVQGKTFKATTMIAQALPYGPYGQGGNHGKACHTSLRESASIEEPFYQFMKMNLEKGVFPLWNPHQCCGTPTSLMMEAGTFFPLTLIAYVFPSAVSFDLLVLARMLVGALLMYWLMYVWGFGVLARIAAAMVFVLTGPMVTAHLWFVNVDLLLPFLFLTTYKIFNRGSIQNRILLSLAIALSIFGGHVEHIFYVHFLLVLYVIFLFVQDKNRSHHEKRICFKNLLLFYFLGLGMAAVALVPFLADFAHAWSPHTTACGSSTMFPVMEWMKRLITVIVPYFFQPVLSSLEGQTYNWGAGYIGALVVVLGILGLWYKKQRPLVIFFAIAGFIAYGMSSGSFYTQWIGYLPIFNMMYAGIHTINIFVFLLAFLVGAGIEELVVNTSRAVKRAIAVIVGTLAIIIFYLWIYRAADFSAQSLKASLFTASFLLAAVLWLGACLFLKEKKSWIIGFGVLVLLAVELFSYVPRYRPQRFDSFPRVPYIEFIKERTRDTSFRSYGLFLTFYRNTAMAYGVDGFTGSQALYPRRYTKFVQQLIDSRLFASIVGPRPPTTEGFEKDTLARSDVLALANVNYFILPEQSYLGPTLIYDSEVQAFPLSSLLPLPSALPRAYLAYDWTFKEKGKGSQEVLDLMKNKSMEAIPRVIIETDRDDRLPKPSISSRRGILPAEEQKRWANGVVLKARSDQPCFLVLLDAYFPGWKAWIDGKPAKIYPANYLFRAVFLPAGEHVVIFRFVPFWFYVGLGVTFLSFVCGLYFLMRRKS